MRILSHVAKHIKECHIDYEAVDLDIALAEALKNYKQYLEMKKNEKFKPKIEHKYFK